MPAIPAIRMCFICNLFIFNTKSETKQEVFTPRKNNKNKRSNHTNFTNFSVTQLVTDELEKFYDF